MPPPQYLLSPTIRGFVCRSCLLKIQQPRRQPIRWLARQATSDGGPRRRPVKGEFSFYDQGDDGLRTETDTITDADIAEDEATRKEIRDLERKVGKPLEEMDGNDLRNLSPEDLGVEAIPGEFELEAAANAIDAEMEQFENILQKVGSSSDMENLSPEEKQQLRAQIMKLTSKDEPPEQLPLPPPEEFSPDPAPESMFARMVALITGSTPAEAEQEILFEQFPEHHQTVLWNLQKALSSVKNNKDRQETRNLFKLYLLARKGLLSQPKMIPKATWMALWKAFSGEGSHNPDRMARIKRLGDDMELARFTLEPSKYILYIEALFVEGAQASAIQNWEKSVSTLGSEGSDIWKAYWELGLRMFCEAGELDRALETAERLLRAARQPSESRILLPVVKACLASKSNSSVQRAWALYIRMRSRMGSEMNMEDYDAIISMFLAVNEPDLALGIFKDMMLTGDDYALLRSDSIAQYRKVTGFTGDLSPATIEQQELNWQTPRNLARLPAKFRNKFFFGSWMKKLIGERQLNEAKQVLDLMQDRGIRPSAIQMNGLIGAWFREGTERNRVNAEDMAWRMIKARIDLVEARSISYNLQAPLRTVRSPNLEDKKSILLTTSATIETFCVLIEQYRRRQKFDKMADVLAAVHKAHLPINTYFMNQLLLTDAKTNPYGWKTYLSLTNDKGVVPDFKTYINLWKLMKRTLDPVKAAFKDKLPADFPTCREVFADMVANIPALTQKGEIPRDLYELVIQSFCFAQDQPGTAVALRALQQNFSVFPNPETGRTIVLSLARLGLLNEAGKQPRRLNLGSSITKARIEGVTRILQLFKSQREEALLKQGIVLDQMEGDERSDETLYMLSDLLRYSAQMRFAEEVPKFNASEACIKAAEEMGVPDCVPWVPL